MATYGERLKEARLKQGRTLEEIAAHTRIQPQYLEAMESNQIERIPGDFFRKSFLKQYAETLGLNPDEFKQDETIRFGKYEEGQGQKLSERLPEHPDLPPIPQPGSESRFPLRQVLLSLGLLIGVIAVCAVAYTFWEDMQNREQSNGFVTTPAPPVVIPESTQPEPTPAAPETEQPAATEQTADSSTGTPATTEESPATTTPAPVETAAAAPATAPASNEPRVHGSGSRELRLSATGLVWVQAKEGDRTVFVGTIDKGETRILRLQEGARVVVGNAGALSAVWQGKDIGTVGPLGQVRILTVNPQDATVAAPQRNAPAGGAATPPGSGA